MVRRFKQIRLVLPLIMLLVILAGCGGKATTSAPAASQTPTAVPTSPSSAQTTKPTSTQSPVSLSWKSMGGPPGGRISQLFQNPDGAHELYALAPRGIYQSLDKGESWQFVTQSENLGINCIAVYQDEVFAATGSGIYAFKGNASREKARGQGGNNVFVSDNKLFVTISTPDSIQPGIYFTDLSSGNYDWKEITPSLSQLKDIRLPDDKSLQHFLSVQKIVARGNRILAAITMTIEGSGLASNGGLYDSEDMGKTWAKVSLDAPVVTIISNIVQDYSNPDHIFTLLRHPVMQEYNYPIAELVRESTDGGRTWHRFTESLAESNGVTDIEKMGNTYYLVNPYNTYVLVMNGANNEIVMMPQLAEYPNVTFMLDGLIFDPDNPSIVYGKGGGIWTLGLLKSIDGMKTWHKMDGDIVASSPIVVVADPANPDAVYEGGNMIQEKYYTRDGGKTWLPFTQSSAVNEIKVDPYNSSHVVYVDEMSGIFESTDGGKTFTQINNNFSSAKIPSMAVDPNDPGNIIVSNLGTGISDYQGISQWHYMTGSPDYAYDIKFDPEDSHIIYATYSPKIFENFSSVWRYDPNQPENYGWKEILHLDGAKGITSLEFSPTDSKTIYVGAIGEGGTIYVSHDKGNTWSKLNDALNFTTIWGQSQLQIDPRDKKTVYAGTWGGGTYKTTDGGSNWQQLDITQTFSPTCLAIAPSNPDIIYACDRTSALIHRSDDAGKTWRVYYDFGAQYFLSSAVAIDPNNPDIIYASAFKPPLAHRGAFVKIENGQKTADLGTDLPRSVLDITLDKQNPGVIYVTTHVYGVFKSTDGGVTFTRLDDKNNGLPRTGFYHIEIDPADSSILYGTALSGALPDYMLPSPDFPNLEGKSGVYKSTDAGENWNLILSTVSEARGISIDPQNTSNLYTADMMGGVWVSNDAGQSWRQENNGLGSISMTSVKIKDGYIYASTQGSGVYSGVINKDNSITWDSSRSNKPKAYVSKIQIKVDPTNANRIFAAGYPGGLLRSDDGGLHWNDKNFLTPSIRVTDPAAQGYYSFDISPIDSEVIWLGAYGKGMYVSYDGMEYDMAANGADNIMMGKHITDVRVDPNDVNTVYAATQEGVFVTHDSGAHWTAINDGLDTLDIKSLRVQGVQWAPFNSNFNGGSTEGWSMTDAQGDVSSSSWAVVQDNGNDVLQGTGHAWAHAGMDSWTDYTFTTRFKILQGGVHINVRQGTDGRYFLHFGQDGAFLAKSYNNWSQTANLAAMPNKPNNNQWYVLKIEVSGGSIKVYLDDVKVIDYTDPTPLPSGAIAFETLDDSTVYFDDIQVVPAPSAPVVFAGTAGYGIYKLDNATMKWGSLGRTLGIGFWTPWQRRMYQFASILFDPDVRGKVYYGTFPGGFYVSTDGGHTWKDSSLGIGNDGIFSSVVMQPQNHKIMFAGSYNGVVTSKDGGMTWTNTSNGIPSEQWPYTLAIDSNNADIMYICTKNGQNKGFAYRNSFNGVVMKSTDGGANWVKIMNGLDDKTEFYNLIIYPLNHDILFLSTNRGVYVSQDAGKSWKAANTGLPSTNNQVRDNVAQNMALTSDNRYLILGLVDYGIWKADISGLVPNP
jgi:photosystem II stability/assembly factor-like uncharacterized protein